MARSTVKFTDDTGDAIVRDVERGLFPRQAAARQCVPESVLNDWLELGRAGREPYATFATDLDAAEADSALKLIAAITDSAKTRPSLGGDWKAAAWLLERKYPALFGPRSAGKVAELKTPAAAARRVGEVFSPFKPSPTNQA